MVFWDMALCNLRERHKVLDELPLSIFRVQELDV
jgi:hypothetical protein